MIRILSLVENTAGSTGLLGEHGLAVWIDTGEYRVLFDTGQGMALLHNARKLGIPLARTNAIVLSHGHYDHTGGLTPVLDLAPKAKLYAHPAAFRRRFVHGRQDGMRDVGVPVDAKERMDHRGVERVNTIRPTEVVPGLYATGTVPRRTPYEEVSGPFFLDAEASTRDPLEDDQALFFDTYAGMVVLLGCAHAGVINTLRYVKDLTDCRSFAAVAGGMHLKSASEDRLDHTIEAMDQLDIRALYPGHCTGARAAARMWHHFAGRCDTLAVGTEFAFAQRSADSARSSLHADEKEN